MSGEQPAIDTYEESVEAQQVHAFVMRMMMRMDVLVVALEVFFNEKVLTGMGDILLQYVLYLYVFG